MNINNRTRDHNMKILFVVPEIRLDSHPTNIPFWAGILASIVEQKRR